MNGKLKLFFAIAGLLSLLLSGSGFALTKWACVGDSITAGWKLKEADTYCYKLGVLLGSDEYETTNFGHSARTMLRNPNEGWPYWDSPLFIESQQYGPDIVSIMLGTNDAHPNNWPELAAEYARDARDMVTLYQNLPGNPRVILMTIPPAKEGNSRNPAILEVNAILHEVAAATGAELADVWSAIDNSDLSEREKFRDPIHLNAPAHTVIAELLHDHVTGGGPSCGDGQCSNTEDPCNCPADCGSPPATETGLCSNAVDDDCDGDTDCADADCVGDPACPISSELFGDGFESGNFTTGGWIPSGNAVVQRQAAYTGSFGAKLQGTGSLEVATSTLGSSGLFLEYDRVTINFEPADDSFTVEWFDGTSWHLIEETADTDWVHVSFALPEAADNNPDFRIRFTCNGNHPAEKVYLDNVKLLD
jgi:lysophospholipase L1-like esterase